MPRPYSACAGLRHPWKRPVARIGFVWHDCPRWQPHLRLWPGVPAGDWGEIGFVCTASPVPCRPGPTQRAPPEIGFVSHRCRINHNSFSTKQLPSWPPEELALFGATYPGDRSAGSRPSPGASADKLALFRTIRNPKSAIEELALFCIIAPVAALPAHPRAKLGSFGTIGRKKRRNAKEICSPALSFPRRREPTRLGSKNHPRGRVGFGSPPALFRRWEPFPNAIFSRLGSRCYMSPPPTFESSIAIHNS